MAKKELSWKFIRQAGGRKYFLVEKAKGEYAVFRFPSDAKEGSKKHFILGEWSGEIVSWGSTPTKVRNWILRHKLWLSPEKKDTLTLQT